MAFSTSVRRDTSRIFSFADLETPRPGYGDRRFASTSLTMRRVVSKPTFMARAVQSVILANLEQLDMSLQQLRVACLVVVTVTVRPAAATDLSCISGEKTQARTCAGSSFLVSHAICISTACST